MPGMVVGKWKAAKSPQVTGGAISKSSLLEAFSEWLQRSTTQSGGREHFLRLLGLLRRCSLWLKAFSAAINKIPERRIFCREKCPVLCWIVPLLCGNSEVEGC